MEVTLGKCASFSTMHYRVLFFFIISNILVKEHHGPYVDQILFVYMCVCYGNVSLYLCRSLKQCEIALFFLLIFSECLSSNYCEAVEADDRHSKHTTTCNVLCLFIYYTCG